MENPTPKLLNITYEVTVPNKLINKMLTDRHLVVNQFVGD